MNYTCNKYIELAASGNHPRAVALGEDLARRIRFVLHAQNIPVNIATERPFNGIDSSSKQLLIRFRIRIEFDRSPFSEAAEFFFDSYVSTEAHRMAAALLSDVEAIALLGDEGIIQGSKNNSNNGNRNHLLYSCTLILHLSRHHDEEPWYDVPLNRNRLCNGIATLLFRLNMEYGTAQVGNNPIEDYSHTYNRIQKFDVFHQVPLIAQVTGMNCWAAAAAMVVGWRDQTNLETDDISATIISNYPTVNGLLPHDVETLARIWGLFIEPPVVYSVASLSYLCSRMGPLWMGQANPDLHVIVVTGIHGDGSPEGSFVRINDPWPAGKGQRYSLPFSDLKRRYTAATRIAGLHVQVMHAGGRRKGSSAIDTPLP